MENKGQQQPLFQSGASGDDSFYDRIDHTAEYDNEINNSSQTPEERDREREMQLSELAKLEEEIMTLRSVLTTKQREAAEIKHKLGITPIAEMKKDLKTGINNIRESETYQKTNQAFKSIGAWSSKKIGEVRNSNSFKSFEERVGGAYSSVKQSRSYGNLRSKMSRMTGSRSEDNFDEALRAHQENGSASSTEKLPEEKAPL